jgi:hypothetical protein
MLIGVLYFTLASCAHAQFGGLGRESSLSVTPNFPEPFSTAVVSLDAYTMNTTNATITWYVDGTLVANTNNARSIEVALGELGKKITVRAVIGIGGSQTSLSTVIVPTVTNIHVEADTYIPLTYAGRALPSEGSKVRAVAVVLAGGNTDPASYSYLWKRNGGVLFGGAIRGKQIIELEMSQYQGDALTVEVFSGGKLIGGKTISLTPSEPVLRFYEDNPLRGMHHRAIANSYQLLSDEVTVRAVPYFMDTDLTPQTTSIEWSVNGGPATPNTDPGTITLRKVNEGGGSATVGLRLLLTRKVPQYLTGAFNVAF